MSNYARETELKYFEDKMNNAIIMQYYFNQTAEIHKNFINNEEKNYCPNLKVLNLNETDSIMKFPDFAKYIQDIITPNNLVNIFTNLTYFQGPILLPLGNVIDAWFSNPLDQELKAEVYFTQNKLDCLNKVFKSYDDFIEITKDNDLDFRNKFLQAKEFLRWGNEYKSICYDRFPVEVKIDPMINERFDDQAPAITEAVKNLDCLSESLNANQELMNLVNKAKYIEDNLVKKQTLEQAKEYYKYSKEYQDFYKVFFPIETESDHDIYIQLTEQSSELNYALLAGQLMFNELYELGVANQ